jgi:guanine nucleotide exchange factor for Rho/Rac/Cdc42-like GTPase family protein
MKPMQREAARGKPILKSNYTSVIFAYLDVILGHNTRLLLGLEKRITTCMTEAMFQQACIGDLFENMKGQFASTYTKYVINHPEAIATLNERTRKNKSFSSFLKVSIGCGVVPLLSSVRLLLLLLVLCLS